jgi:hypothetical protein
MERAAVENDLAYKFNDFDEASGEAGEEEATSIRSPGACNGSADRSCLIIEPNYDTFQPHAKLDDVRQTVP